jgi:ribosomal protein S18 acetylase RimI-like enzyme
VFATAADLASMLASRHVFHQRYSYRLRRLDEAPSPMVSDRQPLRWPGLLRAWSESDIDATSELLYESYEQNAGPIGPGATLHDWREYVTNLSRHGGCGTLSPVLSRVLTIDGVVAAATLVSTIAPQTAHLVQLAVRRAHQGAGLGHALLTTAVEASRHAGFLAISLLVAQDNEAALRLYQQAGFVEQATFVALRASAELRTLNSERRNRFSPSC